MALSGPPLPKKVNTPHATAPYLLLNRLITMILGKLGAIYFVNYFVQRPTICILPVFEEHKSPYPL